MKPNLKTLARLLGGAVFALSLPSVHAIPLADAPIFATQSVPGNLALALSVEFPTAISVANLGNYVHANTYLGYFDPNKCYTYTYNATTPNDSYFQPAGLASGHTCTGKWSGNFMNWVAMQTIDPFRWALTGGYRATDTTSLTILQKAFGSAQGSAGGNYPYRGTASPTSGSTMPTADVAKVTPFSGTRFNTRLWGKGVDMVFSTANSNDYQNNSPKNLVHYGSGATSKDENYYVRIRVRVCDSSTAAGGLESNCVQYGSNYKPEGLMQQYSNKIRYSALAYLTDSGQTRQGAALRAKMGFIGPTYPIPLSTTPGINATGEWDATTGIMSANPDSAMGAAQSGAMNYLNQFGNHSSNYKMYDNVSELYYAAVRYLQNQGNVPEWTNGSQGTSSAAVNLRDNFPAATTWDDPILYSCQKNFILGIGDSNTHFDINTGGSEGLTNAGGSPRPMPATIAADTFNKSAAWTRLIERAEGLTSRGLRYGATPGSEFIAGLAYGNHVYDMRSDLEGKQTINTYWMDVMEGQYAQDKSPYWLAAKYGGFAIPNGFDPTSVTAMAGLDASTWSNTGEALIDMYPRNSFNSGSRVQRPRPQNFFLAGNAAQMVSGLSSAFNSIAQAVNSYTTAVTPAANVVTSAGTTSFSASYGSEFWTGRVVASPLTFTATTTTVGPTSYWDSNTVLTTQFQNPGNRVIVTWNSATDAGIPFRHANLPATARAALDTSFVTGDDSANYLNYLRGDKTYEINATTPGSPKVYRERRSPLGDIVNSKLTLSAAPRMPYSDSNGNDGYAAFKAAKASRTPLVLFGANDGMLHALNGSTSGTDMGKEVFAYVPAATFTGPNGNAANDGLAALGNPSYAHRFYVDATPQVFDVDFSKVQGGSATTDWRTIVVGGMGKGGKSFFALDITDPASMTSEANVASKVLWEINSTTPGFGHLGFSYGTPIMAKTKKYGWTLLLTSGYNNDDGQGYLYLVNPKSGALLDTISTGAAAPGMTQASAFINDYTDGTADAVYVGDLNGKVWRFDLTTSGTYPTPQVLFEAESTDGTAQAITVAPIPEIHPTTRERMILFGTGRLLDGQDISSAQEQSFYAISDGDNLAFASIGSALDRSDLTHITSLTTAVTLAPTSRGWFYDLGTENGIGWRVTLTAAAADGVVLFTTTLPSGDPCSPAGKGRAYVVDYSRGFNAISNNSTGFIALASAPTDNILVKVDGVLRGIVGDALGNPYDVAIDAPASLGVRLINWREVEAVD